VPAAFQAIIKTMTFSFVNTQLDLVFIIVQLDEPIPIDPLVFPEDAPRRMKAECKAVSLKSRSSGMQSNAGRII
jgi:hypothetical protein